MEINLKRPLVFFDIESTGLDVSKDRIVEISVVKLYPKDGAHPQGRQEIKTKRINPQMHIPEQSTAIHHITDEDVKDCPTFRQYAKSLAAYLEGCDIAGYNSLRFDIPLLAEEFERCDVDFDFSKHRLIDVQNIFHKMEERTLSAAYKFYCQKNLEEAHSAEADTVATMEVLKAQLDRYKEPDKYRDQVLRNDVASLASFVGRKYVDFSGHLILDENGEILINFGKHKGKTARKVFETEPSYFAWIQQGSFTLDTKAQFARLEEQFKRERLAAKWNGRLF